MLPGAVGTGRGDLRNKANTITVTAGTVCEGPTSPLPVFVVHRHHRVPSCPLPLHPLCLFILLCCQFPGTRIMFYFFLIWLVGFCFPLCKDDYISVCVNVCKTCILTLWISLFFLCKYVHFKKWLPATPLEYVVPWFLSWCSEYQCAGLYSYYSQVLEQ